MINSSMYHLAVTSIKSSINLTRSLFWKNLKLTVVAAVTAITILLSTFLFQFTTFQA